MQAILVRRLFWTNKSPTRYIATSQPGRTITKLGQIPAGCEDHFRFAAEAHCDKLHGDWRKDFTLIEGTLPNGDGCFVFQRRQSIPETIGKKAAKHLYSVEYRFPDGTTRKSNVHAANRDQAARICDQFDVTVLSVNLIG